MSVFQTRIKEILVSADSFSVEVLGGTFYKEKALSLNIVKAMHTSMSKLSDTTTIASKMSRGSGHALDE